MHIWGNGINICNEMSSFFFVCKFLFVCLFVCCFIDSESQMVGFFLKTRTPYLGTNNCPASYRYRKKRSSELNDLAMGYKIESLFP